MSYNPDPWRAAGPVLAVLDGFSDLFDLETVWITDAVKERLLTVALDVKRDHPESEELTSDQLVNEGVIKVFAETLEQVGADSTALLVLVLGALTRERGSVNPAEVLRSVLPARD